MDELFLTGIDDTGCGTYEIHHNESATVYICGVKTVVNNKGTEKSVRKQSGIKRKEKGSALKILYVIA